jgi:hypothetical protein
MCKDVMINSQLISLCILYKTSTPSSHINNTKHYMKLIACFDHQYIIFMTFTLFHVRILNIIYGGPDLGQFANSATDKSSCYKLWHV